MSVDFQQSDFMVTAGEEEPSSSPRWLVLAAFGIAFAGMLFIALLQAPKPFYYDSAGYWSLGETFVVHGHFSLLNFHDQIRGYALPLMYHGLQVVSGQLAWTSSSLVKLYNVVVFALIGGVLGPRLAEIAFGGRRWGLGRRVTLSALLVVFWSGDLNYPLSDFPGLAIALLAVVAVARPDSPGWMLVAGAAGAIAIDVRAAYLLLAPTLIVLLAWAWFDQRGTKHRSGLHRALCAGLLIIGFAAGSLPQSLSAHRYSGTWSFVPDANANVSSIYLTPGLLNQRYDTYVGPGPAPSMFYGDETGTRLLAKQKNEAIESSSQYVKLIVDHPLAMGDMFARHAINGLDVRYSTAYIEHLETHRWLRIAGFLLVFLALVRVLWPAARRRLAPTRWRYIVALLVCCLTSLTTPTETRYLLPTYISIYILVLAPGWPNPLGQRGTGLRRLRTLAFLAVCGVVFSVVVEHVVTETSRQLHFG